MPRSITGGLFAAVAALADSAAADPASLLARILAAKGVITSTELSGVESAAEGQRVALLASLLQQKGLISVADLAGLPS